MNSSSNSSFKVKKMTVGTVKMLYLPDFENKNDREGLNTKIKRMEKVAFRKSNPNNRGVKDNILIVQSTKYKPLNSKLLQLSKEMAMNIYHSIFILLYQTTFVILFGLLIFDIVSKSNSIRIF